MRQKSLRQLARELGVSASYLSQVRHGKRPASERLLSKLNTEVLSSSVKQNIGGSAWESNPPRTVLLPLNGVEAPHLASKLLNEFLSSRRDGLSPETTRYYTGYLNLARSVVGTRTTGHEVKHFLDSLQCSNGGKHAYYRALRAFYNWLYSPKSGHGLNPQDNPILMVESPKVEKKILPSFTPEQIAYLMGQADCVRDRAIISLFSDSGLRLSELASIKPENIDWENRLVKVWCKGSKEGLAPFGGRTESLLREWLSQYNPSGNIWGMDKWQIGVMLRVLRAKTGLPCNAHTFRRSFATILANRGVDSIHIMRLGRWESISMVERYTRSVRFHDSVNWYTPIVE